MAVLAKSFHVHYSTLYRYPADDQRVEKALKTLAAREAKRRRR